MYPKASEIIMDPDLPGSSITTLLKTAHFYWSIMIIKDGERPFEQHQNRVAVLKMSNQKNYKAMFNYHVKHREETLKRFFYWENYTVFNGCTVKFGKIFEHSLNQ